MSLKEIIFLSEPLETIPWVIQLILMTAAYVILCQKPRQGGGKRSWAAMLPEGLVL